MDLLDFSFCVFNNLLTSTGDDEITNIFFNGSMFSYSEPPNCLILLICISDEMCDSGVPFGCNIHEHNVHYYSFISISEIVLSDIMDSSLSSSNDIFLLIIPRWLTNCLNKICLVTKFDKFCHVSFLSDVVSFI